MKIESAAGEFDFDIEALKVSKGKIILMGKMGVWEAETTMTKKDMRKMLRLTLLKPAFWVFLCTLPFGGGKNNKDANKNAN